MAKNVLSKARDAKQDEFYTQLPDVEKELTHYRDHFFGKIIYLNCDDPDWSSFWLYFSYNFDFFGLKKIISTHYEDNGNSSYMLMLEEQYNANKPNIVKKTLKGNGDFRSDECIELLKEADIVVTNPPFSLFREYVAQLIEYDKKFIIIGNQNAFTYKEIFPLLQDDKMWTGYKNGDMAFKVPDWYETRPTRFWIDKNGQKWRSLGNICWFTNLDIKKRYEDLVLTEFYEGNEDRYSFYDNYDAINVGKISEIPMDYEGVMGVPITFLNSHNPDQFEILGLSQKVGFGLKSHKFYDDYIEVKGDGTPTGSSGKKTNGNPVLAGNPQKGNYYVNDNGDTAHSLYARIFIKNNRPISRKEMLGF